MSPVSDFETSDVFGATIYICRWIDTAVENGGTDGLWVQYSTIAVEDLGRRTIMGGGGGGGI